MHVPPHVCCHLLAPAQRLAVIRLHCLGKAVLGAHTEALQERNGGMAAWGESRQVLPGWRSVHRRSRITEPVARACEPWCDCMCRRAAHLVP